jgi:WD40 repeat protein
VDENDEPRVTDFGLAKRAGDEADLTLTGQVIGTPAYMSPEQAGAKKFGPVGPRSDVYALGAILYHLLTGRAPFTGDTVTDVLRQAAEDEPVSPRLLNPKLPRDLETVCLKCLAKEPRARYASAQALADDLGRFFRGETITARPAGPAEKLWRWCRRNPALASALGACAVVLFAGGAGILWKLKQTEAARQEAVQKAQAESAQRQLAEQARQQAEASELVMRQNLYAADMMAAQRALDRNDLGTARLLLNNHRPRPGQEDLRGFEWRYMWKLAQGNKCVVLTNATGPVKSMAVSADGKWLTFAGSEVIVCDAETFQERARANIHSQSVAFAPDSPAIFIGDWTTGTVLRWEWENGSQPWALIPPSVARPNLAISPAGETIALGSGNSDIEGLDGLVTLYDLRTGQKQFSLPESGGIAAFSPIGKLLATASWQDKVKLWNPSTGQLVGTFTNVPFVYSLSFAPEGQTLAICTGDSDSTWLYDVATGMRRKTARDVPCCVVNSAWSADAGVLATVGTDESVRLWDAKSGKQLATLLGHGFAIDGVAWMPGEKMLATAGDDHTVRLWDVASSITPSECIPGRVIPGYFSASGKLVAMEGEGGSLGVREMPSLRVICGSRPVGEFVGFTKDDSALLTVRRATNGQSAELISWQLPGLIETNRITLGPCGPVNSPLDLSPDCALLATPGAKGELRVWDLARNGKAAGLLTIPNAGNLSALHFTPDGRKLVVAFFDSKTGYLWNLKSERPEAEYPGMSLGDIRFSSEGRTVIGNNQSSVGFWETATGTLIGTTIGRWGGVNFLDASADGKTVLFYTRMGVRFWNAATRRECGLIAIEKPPISTTAFSPDGNLLFVSQRGPEGFFTTTLTAPSFEQTDGAENP